MAAEPCGPRCNLSDRWRQKRVHTRSRRTEPIVSNAGSPPHTIRIDAGSVGSCRRRTRLCRGCDHRVSALRVDPRPSHSPARFILTIAFERSDHRPSHSSCCLVLLSQQSDDTPTPRGSPSAEVATHSRNQARRSPLGPQGPLDQCRNTQAGLRSRPPSTRLPTRRDKARHDQPAAIHRRDI